MKALKKNAKWDEDLEEEENKDLSNMTPEQIKLYEKHQKIAHSIKE